MKNVRRKRKIKINKKFMLIFLCVLLTFLVLFGLFKIFNLERYIIPIYKVEDRTSNFKKVKKKYKDATFVGWIRVQGTNIDYPVINVKSESDINQDFNFAWINKNITKLSNHLTILGHNIRNVSSNPIIGDDKMNQFEQLPSYIYYGFNRDNKYIQFTINGENYLYQIFSVSLVDSTSVDYFSTSYSKKKQQEYIKQTLKDSYFKYNTKVNSEDSIISLVTCTRFNGSLSKQFKIDARLVKNAKKGYNYGAEEKENYKEVKKILKGDGKNV